MKLLNKDWTDNYRQQTVSDFADSMVKEIIREIHSEKLTIHTAYSLTLKELGMIYRWPLYIGVNTFMERLIEHLMIKIGVLSHIMMQALATLNTILVLLLRAHIIIMESHSTVSY